MTEWQRCAIRGTNNGRTLATQPPRCCVVCGGRVALRFVLLRGVWLCDDCDRLSDPELPASGEAHDVAPDAPSEGDDAERDA